MKKQVGRWMAVILLSGITLWAEPPTPFKALARMPVKEVTVFKDGHAFLLHAGKMPVGPDGNVVMDYLPTPVLGTFWPYAADKKAKLAAVKASQQKVLVDRTALNLKELIEANLGAEVTLTETASPNNLVYRATLLDFPKQKSEEPDSLDVEHSGEKPSQQGDVVLLKTAAGVKVVKLERIQDISFTGDYQKMLPREEIRNLLTLSLDWGGHKPLSEAEVGLVYLQRGIRWIPGYRVTLDGNGQAIVKLQATLINEIADLDDATLHLVIGVPSFEFKEIPDPISLQKTFTQLSSYFQPDSRSAFAFSNAIMSQQAVPTRNIRQEPAPESRGEIDLGPDIAESAKAEDLFVFTVKSVSLHKGQRMVFTIGEFTMNYKDIYSLQIPFTPPPEVWRNYDSHREAELARLFSTPGVMHRIRLHNSSPYPLTTAPALIFRGDRILAQSLMTYAAPESDANLEITTALDVRVKKSDNETKRTPNAVVWQGDNYGRIDLAGKITLTNFRKDSVEVEVVRHVLGNIDAAGNSGKTEMTNIFEDSSFADRGGLTPAWWTWYSWPIWWHRFNSVGRIAWTVTLEPNKPMDLSYTWHYFWR
jgi:hypothetical protein